MVSGSLDGRLSLIGDGLALLIAAIVRPCHRRYQTPRPCRHGSATCLGVAMGARLCGDADLGLSCHAPDLGFLMLFGAINLGAGLALFTVGARLIPATLAALLSLIETVLSPLWVWLIHGEAASGRALIGGAVILTALVGHILVQSRGQTAA